MGTWDLGPFDNDDAADFLYEVQDAAGWGPAVAAMAKVLITVGYLEAPESQRGLAAAALVASRRSPGSVKIEATQEAIAATLPPPPYFAPYLAKLTIGRVISRSELADLWAEGSELEAWRTETRRVLQAL
ncbi:DUF4259 domain-containing protein [Brevundimonas sp.]|uniref:DUF4259 domain-containing protein n=1 Tax=Brevundimonas sp. TaxID=1871086 RepID=UPI002D599181|nr:DUF4259 domain-containing protein [Brevundimonas sp.]HYC96803.1 DUF4259 domain-containing protein [Brevundimonas sp.]